jgi:hypothetical protein
MQFPNAIVEQNKGSLLLLGLGVSPGRMSTTVAHAVIDEVQRGEDVVAVDQQGEPSAHQA